MVLKPICIIYVSFNASENVQSHGSSSVILCFELNANVSMLTESDNVNIIMFTLY